LEEEQKELLLNEEKIKAERALMLRRKMAADTENKEVITHLIIVVAITTYDDVGDVDWLVGVGRCDSERGCSRCIGRIRRGRSERSRSMGQSNHS
jgi:hypothetical protein